jgi:hypothetical protein
LRRSLAILLPLLIALLTPAGAWTANTSANFGIMITAAQTIASVNLSNNNFAGGAPSGTMIGSISVAMSPASPAFSGTLSLSGSNAGNFQIDGSNLLTNGVNAAGTYNVNIVASEAGAAGLPFVQSETVTGTSSSLSACNALTFTYDLVTDFGAANGGSTATNDGALKAFNNEAQKRTRPPEAGYPGYPGYPGYYANANKDNCVVLNIPAGTFAYSWNHYADGIGHLKIVGAGSGLNGGSVTALQNTNSDGSYDDEVAFQIDWDYFNTPSGANYGYFIKQANAGDSQVSLAGSPANADNFYIGRWVLIWSYVQDWFGGYPPNPRYYDYAKVTGINSSTGVITLDTPLTFTHRPDRPYIGTLTDGPTNAGTWGPARITPIDRPGKPIGVYHAYSGIHVLGNPNWTLGSPENGDVWALSGLIDGSANDMLVNRAVGMSMLRDFTISNSQWGWDESDKIVRTMVYDHVTVPRTLHHAGQQLWHVIGGHLGATSIASRHAIFEGGTLIDGMLSSADYTAGIQLDNGWQTVDVLVNGVTFKGNNNTNNAPINAPPIVRQTIDGTVIAVTAGPNGPNTRLKVQKDLGTYNSPSEAIAQNWGEYSPLWKNGTFVTGATVSLITGDANYIYVDVIGTIFNTGDNLWAARVPSVTVENSVGQNTGYGWGSPNFRYPNGNNSIPNIVWTNNGGN